MQGGRGRWEGGEEKMEEDSDKLIKETGYNWLFDHGVWENLH